MMTKDTLLAEAADAIEREGRLNRARGFHDAANDLDDLGRQLRAREDAGKADTLEAARLAPKRVGVIARHTGSMLDMAILKWDEWQPPEGAVLFVVNYGTEGEPLYFPPPDAALSTKPEAGEGEGR